MSKIEKIIKKYKTYIENKSVLEIACGDSDFSLKAAMYADMVTATDISSFRIDRLSEGNTVIPDNLTFYEMDATNLDIENDEFDLAVCFNGMGHLGEDGIKAANEMVRVIRPDGRAMIIGTWKLEFPVIEMISQHFKGLGAYSVEDISNKDWNGVVISKGSSFEQ